jgi:starch-binding outer membrane protein, SusD/RagB family
MKNKIIIIGILFGFIFFSCADFLDKYPHSDVTMDQAIKTQADVDVAVNGIYSGFKSPAYYGRAFVVYPDVMTDEVTAVLGFSNQLGILYKWIHTATDGDVEAIWATMYSVIARANTVINSVDDIEGDKATLNYYKGEALMARALAHFDLVRLFAKSYNASTASTDLGVPYMLEFKVSQPARDNVQKVYDNIIADIQAAIPLMETSPYTDKTDTYFSVAAANALLARVSLYMKDWDHAIAYAKIVLDNPNYSLNTGDDFTKMWLNDTGSEIIWKVGLTVNDAAGSYIGYNYYNDSQGNPSPDYIPTENFMSIYDKVNDQRFSTYYKSVETKYMADDSNIVMTLCDKYPTNPEFASTANANGSNMPKVFRLSEMYLICAEAYAEKGDGATGWQYIQSLRSVRINGYNPANDPVPSNVKEEIFTERKRELAFEGHLWFDYKRKGLGFTREGKESFGNNKYSNDNDPKVVNPNDYRWIFPIPQTEINANKGIASQQNPGY